VALADGRGGVQFRVEGDARPVREPFVCGSPDGRPEVGRTVAAEFVRAAMCAGDDDRRLAGEVEIAGRLRQRIGPVDDDEAVGVVVGDPAGHSVAGRRRHIESRSVGDRLDGDVGVAIEVRHRLQEIRSGKGGSRARPVAVGRRGDGAVRCDDVDVHV